MITPRQGGGGSELLMLVVVDAIQGSHVQVRRSAGTGI